MKLTNEQLKEILLKNNLLNSEQLETAAKDAGVRNIPLEEYLVETGLISDEKLGEVVADHLKIYFIDLSMQKIDTKMLFLIPEIVARKQQAIAFGISASTLMVATSDPSNYEFFKFLERKTGYQVEVYYATPLDVREALKYYKSDLAGRINSLIEGILTSEDESEENIVKVVNLLLEYAYDNRASDIHLEPFGTDVSVRFRIDGILHEVSRYPKNLHAQMVFLIKIMSKLRTDEHAAAQDGRFTFTREYKGVQKGSAFDVRVSILPVIDGENVVLRLLSEGFRRFTIEELGLYENDRKKITRSAKKPYGMILASGPTGSGKTTTLYAILQILNRPDVNIMTIEDPVEYDIERVQQAQVNPKRNLTFATGLRSIVRQDPDIIMVGEIRDNETAGIAINAAMTGQLLLSTIHANNAATVFPRLIDMGIEPFLVASSVNVVIAQRLVRKICAKCRIPYLLDPQELKTLQLEPHVVAFIKTLSGKDDILKIRFYKGVGCDVCGNTGYSGRIGIFEVMEVGEDLRSYIIKKASSSEIEKKATQLGMDTMLADGVRKVFHGITTIGEIIRATKF